MNRLTYYFDKRRAKALLGNLQKAAGKEWPKIARPMIRAEAKIVLAGARVRVRTRTSTLQKGLTVRAMKSGKGRISYGVATPKRDKLAKRRATGTHKGGDRIGKHTNIRILRKPGYYPAHLELGTRKMREMPYLRPAMKAHERAYPRNLSHKAATAIERLLRVK